MSPGGVMSLFLDRRSFLAVSAAAMVSGCAAGRADAAGQGLVFDALGEMRTTYDMALVDQIIAAGTRAIAVTLTDPKVAEAEAFDAFLKDHQAYESYYAANADRFIRARNVADIDRATADNKIAVFYNLQDSAPAGRDPDGVARLKALGVTSIQLTYNTLNASGAGCFEDVDPGVTPFGRELIARMEAERVLLDLSHAGMKTMADAVSVATRPMIVSHTACKALRDHRRNTTDDNMRAVADKGGLVGITQIRTFLTDAKTGNLGVYFQHIAHAVKRIGADHVCIGSDRDHRVVPDTPEELRVLLQEEGSQIQPNDWPLYLDGLNGPRRMETVRQGLEGLGLSAPDIDKIMGGNLRRLYQDVVG